MLNYVSDIFGNEAFEVESLEEFVSILNGPPQVGYNQDSQRPADLSVEDFDQVGDDYYYNGELVLEAE